MRAGGCRRREEVGERMSAIRTFGWLIIERVLCRMHRVLRVWVRNRWNLIPRDLGFRTETKFWTTVRKLRISFGFGSKTR